MRVVVVTWDAIYLCPSTAVAVVGASHAPCYLMFCAAVVVMHRYDRSSFSTLAFSGRRRSSYRFLWALSPILFRMRRQSFVADLVVLRWFIASKRVRCPRFVCRMYVRSLDYIHVIFWEEHYQIHNLLCEQFFIKTTDAVAIISDSFQIFTIGRAYWEKKK